MDYRCLAVIFAAAARVVTLRIGTLGLVFLFALRLDVALCIVLY